MQKHVRPLAEGDLVGCGESNDVTASQPDQGETVAFLKQPCQLVASVAEPLIPVG